MCIWWLTWARRSFIASLAASLLWPRILSNLKMRTWGRKVWTDGLQVILVHWISKNRRKVERVHLCEKKTDKLKTERKTNINHLLTVSTYLKLYLSHKERRVTFEWDCQILNVFIFMLKSAQKFRWSLSRLTCRKGSLIPATSCSGE